MDLRVSRWATVALAGLAASSSAAQTSAADAANRLFQSRDRAGAAAACEAGEAGDTNFRVRANPRRERRASEAQAC